MAEVIIRADSSYSIGTGHIMRDLVLAEQFGDVIFAVRELDGNINQKIHYDTEILATNDINELIDLIKKHNARTLVIDHYGIGCDDEKRIKEQTGVKLFCLDDTYERHFCDILLNHNISADRERYKGLVPDGCELRCGAKYALIREEFRKAKAKNISRINNRVFVAMGGADSQNMNIRVLEKLSQIDGLSISVVTTTANKRLDELAKYVTDKRIALHVDADNMGELMAGADFGIITPSVSANEAAFMRMPFIALMVADNQIEIYNYLKSKGFLCLTKDGMDALPEYVTLMMKDRQRYAQLFNDITES